MSLLTPPNVLKYSINPALMLLEQVAGVAQTDEARVECLAIAGQESNWEARLQYSGPARSLWQFEKGGGVHGVLTHAASKDKIKAFCDALGIPCDETTVYEAMAWNGFLGAAMARLLLFTDTAPLPSIGKQDQAWEYYERSWRPGAPHPEAWPEKYQTAVDTVAAWTAGGHPYGTGPQTPPPSDERPGRSRRRSKDQ